MAKIVYAFLLAFVLGIASFALAQQSPTPTPSPSASESPSPIPSEPPQTGLGGMS